MKPSLIFDLDGTLIDSLPGIAASLNRTLDAHKLPDHPHSAVRGFIGDGVHTLVRRAAPSGTGPALLDSLVARFKNDYDLNWQDGTQAYPGVMDMLESLRRDGFPMAVLSNKPHDFTVTMTRAFFPDIPFTEILGQRDGIPHKPDPAGAKSLAEALDASPADCIVIGDSTMDIETANNAGMRSIAVTWGYHDRDRLLAAGATRIIDLPEELPALAGTLQ